MVGGLNLEPDSYQKLHSWEASGTKSVKKIHKRRKNRCSVQASFIREPRTSGFSTRVDQMIFLAASWRPGLNQISIRESLLEQGEIKPLLKETITATKMSLKRQYCAEMVLVEKGRWTFKTRVDNKERWCRLLAELEKHHLS